MNTFLLVWNPTLWSVENIYRLSNELLLTGQTSEQWSCQNGTARPGDRVFVTRAKVEPRGLMASGYVTSLPFLGKHHSKPNEYNRKVLIDFDYIHKQPEVVISTKSLKSTFQSAQRWEPHQSGIMIKPHVAAELEKLWFEKVSSDSQDNDTTFDGEYPRFLEGETKIIFSKRYERNPEARRLCIEHYGPLCAVCEINFEKKYGAIGKDFIHVHHLERVSDRKGIYQIDPVKDLRPVCPNCHSIIHKKEPPFSIEEMKELIADSPKF